MTASPGADPSADLLTPGVSLWVDDLSRQRLTSGSLADLITTTKHIVGVTTNPTIRSARARTGAAQ